MKLSMARVSVSSWRRQTCSRMSLRGTISPWWSDEVAEQVGFHEGEVGGAVGRDQLEGVELDGAVVEGVEVGGGSRWRRRGGRGLEPGGAAQHGLESDEEDFKVEGLGEVVVRAGVEAFEDILGVGARGEHEDGEVKLLRTQSADDLKAVLAGEHDVEQDGAEVVFGFEQIEEGFGAVGEMTGAIAFGFEVEEQALGEVFFVFDEDDEGRVHRQCFGA